MIFSTKKEYFNLPEIAQHIFTCKIYEKKLKKVLLQ